MHPSPMRSGDGGFTPRTLRLGLRMPTAVGCARSALADEADPHDDARRAGGQRERDEVADGSLVAAERTGQRGAQGEPAGSDGDRRVTARARQGRVREAGRPGRPLPLDDLATGLLGGIGPRALATHEAHPPESTASGIPSTAATEGDAMSGSIDGLGMTVEELTDAWVYLFGRFLVIRQEHVDLAEDGVTYNAIKHTPPVLSGGEAGVAPTFVNPNLDVVYSEAGSVSMPRRRRCSSCRRFPHGRTRRRRSSTSGPRS